jgi:hypothetical protein
MGWVTSMGAARKRSMASSKLDFPDPFGPMMMFKGSSSTVSAFGP